MAASLGARNCKGIDYKQGSIIMDTGKTRKLEISEINCPKTQLGTTERLKVMQSRHASLNGQTLAVYYHSVLSFYHAYV